MCNYFDISDNYKNIRHWYNGYKFGNVEKIYNPWSITNYTSNHFEGFRPYCVNTSSDDLIKKRIKEREAEDIRHDIEELIKGETIEKLINESIIFADLDTDKELLWTLLFYSGYLTIVKNVRQDIYELKIPNYELKTLFGKIITST